jgi:hypothetical protein
VDDPQATAHFFEWRDQIRDNRTHSKGSFNFAGRNLPTVQFDGKMGTRPISVRIAIPDDSDDRTALETIYETRSTLCLRDFRGRKVFCTLGELPIGDEKWGGFVDANFEAVSYKEEV